MKPDSGSTVRNVLTLIGWTEERGGKIPTSRNLPSVTVRNQFRIEMGTEERVVRDQGTTKLLVQVQCPELRKLREMERRV